MTLLVRLRPSGTEYRNNGTQAASQLRWMAALLLLLVVVHVVTEIDRNQHNRDDHAEQ